MSTVRKLLDMMEPAKRRRLYALVGVMAVGSAFEALGIGLVVPYLNAVTEPVKILNHEWAGPVLEGVGVTRPRQVLVVSSVTIVAVFVVKNAYVAWMWKKVYGFLYGQFASLAKTLLQGYLRVPFTFHIERNSGELIRNTTVESKRVFKGAVASALELMAEALVIIGLVAVLAYVHTLAAGVVLMVLAGAGWGLVSLFRSRLKRIGEIRADNNSRMIQTVKESLGALKEVKVLGRESELLELFSGQAERVAESERDNLLYNTYPRLSLETGLVGGMVGLAMLLVLTGVSLVDAIPVLGVFAVAAVRLMPSINRVVNRMNSLSYETAAVDIVHGELEAIRRVVGQQRPSTGGDSLSAIEEIRVDDLSYRYPEAENWAVEGIDLTIREGEDIGIVGPSGAGKTTLVNLILGLLEPSRGAVLVNGTDIRDALTAWQGQIGYIPQETYLTDQSFRENVGFALPSEKIDDDQVWRALEAAQLADFVRRQEQGLDTQVGDEGVRISGGQRQRVAIARALYHEPEVLVLDEATSSLDPRTESRLSSAIHALAGRTTLITVTHRLNTVRESDRLYMIAGGRVVGRGSYEDLKTNNETFKRMIRRQREGVEAEATSGVRG